MASVCGSAPAAKRPRSASVPEPAPPAAPLGDDPHSFANYAAVATAHVALRLRVDFAARALRGSATHRLRILDPGVEWALFDSDGLTVDRVEGPGGGALEWDTPRSHATLGTCLRVRLPAPRGPAEVDVTIHYATAQEPAGLQWLDAAQTHGGRRPFGFSQFEAIGARTCVPCMDTPAVKATYDVWVDVPKPLAAACSGILQGVEDAGEVGGAPHARHHFRQAVPVPSYLIALVAGDLERRRVGGDDSRCWVWAEPGLVGAAVDEFSGMEEMLSAAEKLTGMPYEWGTYEVLLLPCYFAYAGMENPNLTTLNANLVCGDKSDVDVVAHEIAHSWTGNLVTNCSWTDFWVNEGFTMWLERAIVGEVMGEEMADFKGRLGQLALENALAHIAEPDWRRLKTDLVGVHPDEAFSLVPYEKGYALLHHLERAVGGRAPFLGWLREYLREFAYRSVGTADVRRSFSARFPQHAAAVDWDGWLRGTGAPLADPRATLGTVLSDRVDAVFAEWTERAGQGATAGDVDGWRGPMAQYLLERLLKHPEPLPAELLGRMGRTYGLGDGGAGGRFRSATTRARWVELRLRSGDASAVAAARAFLRTSGRVGHVKPVFRGLAAVARARPELRGDVARVRDEFAPLLAAFLRTSKELNDPVFDAA